MCTFQKTESKSVPWNLSGNPAAVSFGPRRVTNSSKSTWPSPAKKEEQLVFIVAGLSASCGSHLWVNSKQSCCVFTVRDKLKIKYKLCIGLTVHVQSLYDDFQFHLIWHVAQGAHSHAQLLLWNEPIPIAIKHFKGLTDFYRRNTHTQTEVLLRIGIG